MPSPCIRNLFTRPLHKINSSSQTPNRPHRLWLIEWTSLSIFNSFNLLLQSFLSLFNISHFFQISIFLLLLSNLFLQTFILILKSIILQLIQIQRHIIIYFLSQTFYTQPQAFLSFCPDLLIFDSVFISKIVPLNFRLLQLFVFKTQIVAYQISPVGSR